METDLPKFKTIEEEMEYYKQQQRAISNKRAQERAKFGMFDDHLRTRRRLWLNVCAVLQTDSELKGATTKKWMLYKRPNAISVLIFQILIVCTVCFVNTFVLFRRGRFISASPIIWLLVETGGKLPTASSDATCGWLAGAQR